MGGIDSSNRRFRTGLCEPQSPFPGNGILRAEIKAPKQRFDSETPSTETKCARASPPFDYKRISRSITKSCGADFYDMPELERRPNPLQERCQQGSQILGTPSSGRPRGVRRCSVSCVGLACGPCFSISRSHGGRSSNVGCRWPTGAGSTASCVRDDPVVPVTLAPEDGSPIA